MLKGWYYLAHPYSDDPAANVDLSIERTNKLLDLGIKVFNPLTHSHYLDLAQQRAATFWYEFDVAILDKMDGLILSPGWENSRGCILEYGWFQGAIAAGRPIVILHYEDLLKSTPGKK